MTTTTNPVNNAQTEESQTPALVHTGIDLAAMWRRNAEIAEKGADPFINFGSGRLYSNMLEGVPFIFVSGLVYKTQTGGQFGPQRVAQAWIRTFDESWQLNKPELATFTGQYLLSRLEGATERDLVGSYVFTVAPHPTLLTRSQQAPMMIRRYDADLAPPDEDVWGGGQSAFIEKVRTASNPDEVIANRIAEIEEAGPVPPPWETQATGPQGHTRKGTK